MYHVKDFRHKFIHNFMCFFDAVNLYNLTCTLNAGINVELSSQKLSIKEPERN
jgi:hypothetical protein